MAAPSRIGRTRPLVLHVSRGAVEVLIPRTQLSSGATRFRLVRFSSDLELGGALATFIAHQLAGNGVPRRQVIVALAPEMVSTRILELPALTGKDLETVVVRKAAGLCELDSGEAAFAAIALDGEDAPERRWLLHALPRRALTDFQTELRSCGYTVRSVVSARSALFLSGKVEAQQDGADGATLAVLFEKDDCAIGVLDERRIVHLSVVPGGSHTHLNDPDAARAFVHELRSIDAFWRRKSRGRSIASVAVGGVPPSFVERLVPAIRSALGDIPVAALDEHGDPDIGRVGTPEPSDHDIPVDELAPLDRAEESARIAILDAIGTARLDPLDLCVDLRPRVRAIATISLVSALAWGLLAQGVRAEFHNAATALANEVELGNSAASDLATWRDLDSRVQSTEARLRVARDELVAAAAVGLSSETLVAGLFDAFDRDTGLLSIQAVGPALSAHGSAGSIRIRGVVRDVPGRTAAALARFEDRIRALPGIEHVEVELPSLSDRVGDVIGNSTSSLRFSATAELGGFAAGGEGR